MDSFLVLLIDDDPVVQNVVEAILTHHHIRLMVAGNEQETAARLSEARPDIVILDIFLPGLDGYALLKIVKNYVNCPVIATTTYYTSASRATMEAAGFDSFLPKPIVPERLVPLLEEIIHA